MGWNSTLTVVTPAASHDLIDLATFKDDHGVSGGSLDGILARMISRASSAISKGAGRVFAAETVRETFVYEEEARPGPVNVGLSELALARYPLVSITSVSERDTAGADLVTLTASDYKVNYDAGFLYRARSDGSLTRWTAQEIVVEYVGGFSSIPDDLAGAASILAWDRYVSRNQDRTVKSRFVDGVDRVEFYQPGPTIPQEVQDVIDLYRVPTFR